MKFNDYFRLKDVTINITNSCNLNCKYCVSGNTQITMPNLTTKNIKDIHVGDKIVGFNESNKDKNQMELIETTVTHVFSPRYVEKLYHIITENNNDLYITGDHPILNGRNIWTTANSLLNNKEQIKVVNLNNIINQSIKSIDKVEFNDYVYNIETKTHTYIANNILVHNCFEHNKNNQKMTLDNIKIILDKCYENYLIENPKIPLYVNFFGGEPFLNFEAIKYVMEYAYNNNYNIIFGATTNLTILNDDIVETIKKYDLGLLVSLDGVKEIHDRNRCNSYDIVIKNLKKLKEANLLDLVEIRMTVMPEDLPYLKESIISIAELGVKYIAPVPVTDVNWTPNDFVIFEKTLKDVWEWYFEKCENGEEDLHIKLIDDYLENVLWSALNENQKKICSAGTKFSCSIGVEGDILPCHQRHTIKEKYEDLVIGNILKDSEIKTVDFNNETINGFFECNDCIANPVCKGGCPSENLTKNNNGNQLNEIQCLIYMTMVKVAIDFQEKLLNMNPKNERLKIVSENLKLLKNLFEITETKDISKLQNLVEKIEINKEIILPRFNEIIRKICFSLTQHL